MAISDQEVRLPDGRVTLADAATIGDTRFTNGDLAPLPIKQRTWNTYNYAALWIGMSHNIPTYLLASGLIALGMNWVQAVMLIALGNLIVLVPMLLNSHAGTKYGIPYPVFARASFALRGANLAANLRAIIAYWAAPFVLVVAIALFIYMAVKAHGFGNILSQPSKLGWGHRFWPVFFPSLMGMIAFWSTLSLNMPDFTRFSRGQRQQAIGQALGLPTTMTFFSLLAVFITAATQKVYGAPIWDPIQLSGKFHNTAVIAFALFTIVVATLSVNVAANTVAPSYDFSNVAPRFISFRTGSLIAGVVGILIQPWRLLSNPHIYIFAWLGFYGGLLGAIAGVLIADYWVIRRTELRLVDLYRPGGSYWYRRGWNWRALVAFGVGAVLAVGGAYSTPGGGPFPSHGLISPLKPLYDYSWVVGVAVAFVLYIAFSTLSPHRQLATVTAPAR